MASMAGTLAGELSQSQHAYGAAQLGKLEYKCHTMPKSIM